MRSFLGILVLLLLALSLGATTYTEFWVDAAVSANNTNINSGSSAGAPVYTCVNGNWSTVTLRFTPTDGSTPANTVSAGMWGSIYTDNQTNLVQAGITGGSIRIIYSVGAGANGVIQFATNGLSGTDPTTSATARSVRVGGSWRGPYGSATMTTLSFPWNFVAGTATNGPQFSTRVNLKNSASYTTLSALSLNHTLSGPVRFQGYSSTAGDGGKATIDGGATGTGYNIFNISGSSTELVDLIVQNNGNSGGNGALVLLNASGCRAARVIARNSRKSGFQMQNNTCVIVECEAYNCNAGNTVHDGGFLLGGGTCIRCISHDSTTANSSGFSTTGGLTTLVDCISFSNTVSGYYVFNGTLALAMSGCDAYGNTSSGVDLQQTTTPILFYAESCNFIKNGNFGINSATPLCNGAIVNCAFGSGTMTNANGSMSANLSGIQEMGTVTYGLNATPWADPDHGNFSLVLTAARATGRGAFSQALVNSPTNTVGYPDIGAAQAIPLRVIYGFSQ